MESDKINDVWEIIALPKYAALTELQKSYIRYIETFTANEGHLPSYNDLSTFFDKSRSAIHKSLNNDFIRYDPKVGISMLSGRAPRRPNGSLVDALEDNE